eukprot:TRINITY_DN19328_c0_g1_i2.p2 TRINITY_DN19328_c0_g1~~TRINITY_DN19328_c0_g1_i2.p2  ORF type:complete len:196 (+),score=-13.35 TRINITY_DN19328_c0_g1_i2:491-1078(+)
MQSSLQLQIGFFFPCKEKLVVCFGGFKSFMYFQGYIIFYVVYVQYGFVSLWSQLTCRKYFYAQFPIQASNFLSICSLEFCICVNSQSFIFQSIWTLLVLERNIISQILKFCKQLLKIYIFCTLINRSLFQKLRQFLNKLKKVEEFMKISNNSRMFVISTLFYVPQVFKMVQNKFTNLQCNQIEILQTPTPFFVCV